MTLQSLLKCLDIREIEAVRVPDILWMERVEMLGHRILFPLVSDVVLVLGQAVDSIEPALAMVLGQDVGGKADLAVDMIQIQTDKRVLHLPPARLNNSE